MAFSLNQLFQGRLVRTANDGYGEDPGREFPDTEPISVPIAEGGHGKDGSPFQGPYDDYKKQWGSENGYNQDPGGITAQGRPFKGSFGPTTLMQEITSMVGTVGYARQNRYRVYIPVVQLASQSTDIWAKNQILQYADLEATDWVSDYLGGDPNATAMELTVYCDKAQLPSYQYAVIPNRHYGPAFQVPHMPEYQNVTMTFLCSAEMTERYFFETWMYMVMDPISNNFNYRDEYCLDIDILQYKETGEGTELDYNYWTTLVDAYPVALNTQDLGYDINNTIQSVQVTFAYKFAIPFNGKGSTNVGRRGEKEKFRETIKLVPKEPKPPAQ